MKTQIKRMSKSALSVILTICMLISCMMVGTITANAYSITTTTKAIIHGQFDSSGNFVSSWTDCPMIKGGNDYYTLDLTLAANTTFEFGINVSGNGWGPTWCANGNTFDQADETSTNINNGNASNMKLKTITATSGKVKVSFKFWGNYDGESRLQITQTAVAAATNYYVSGGNSPIGGGSWDAAADKMTGSGSSYSITYSSVPAGDYEFKITNGTWDKQWGGDNLSGTLSGTGWKATSVNGTGANAVKLSLDSSKFTSYKVTINFNPNTTKGITLSVTGKTADAYVFGDLTSNGTTWSDSPQYPMTYESSQDRYYYEVKPTIDKNYRYRLQYDGTYYKANHVNTADVNVLNTKTTAETTFGNAQTDGDSKAFYFKAKKGSTYRIYVQHLSNGSVQTWASLLAAADNKLYLVGEMGHMDFWNDHREMTKDDDSDWYSYQVPSFLKDSHQDDFRFQYNGVTYGTSGSDNVNALTYNSSTNTYTAKPGSYAETGYFYFQDDPQKVYTIHAKVNSSANTISFWMSSETLHDGEARPDVEVFAKDGMIREEDSTGIHGDGKMADTTIIADDEGYVRNVADGEFTGSDESSYQTAIATKGQKLTVKTQIVSTKRSKYYVRGYSINGRTYDLYEWNAQGLYTLDYTIPENAPDKIEITPIYYLYNASDTVIIQVSGFDNLRNTTTKTQGSWGTTLYAYTYYDGEGKHDDLGSYPGQPMIYQGGIGYLQVSTTDFYGIVFNNGYLDKVHDSIMEWPDSTINGKYQCQTYDYNDFTVILKENTAKKPNILNFTLNKNKVDNFKNTDTHQVTISFTYTSESGLKNAFSEFEPRRDYYGRKIGILGDTIDESKKPLYVVSDGYSKTPAGAFGTMLYIYAPSPSGNSYTLVQDTTSAKKGIPPAALFVKSESKLRSYSLGDYSGIYNSLQSYKDNPVMISYEGNVYGEKREGEDATNPAYRADGFWSYSMPDDLINANVIIEYRDNVSASWTKDEFKGDTNEGTVTGAKAYFTDKDFDGKTKEENVVSDPSEFFNFDALSGPAKNDGSGTYQYVFDSWVLRTEHGDSEIDTNGLTKGSSMRAGNKTFVARFVKATNGFLTISHVAFDGENSGKVYKGKGTTEIKVDIYNDSDPDKPIKTYDYTDGEIQINSTYIKSNTARSIVVTLKTIPVTGDKFEKFGINRPLGDESEFYNQEVSESINETGTSTRMLHFEISSLFNTVNPTIQDVTSLQYYSYITTDIYKYDITYKFMSRLWKEQSYNVKGEFYGNNFTDFADGSTSSPKLKESVITDNTPKQSNFRKKLSWELDNAYNGQNYKSSSKTIEVTVNSTQEDDNTITGLFKFPYDYDSSKNREIPSYNTNTTAKPFSVDAEGHFRDENNNLIEAAKEITGEDGSPMYFHYWQIYDMNGKEIAKCYFYQFNFYAYENYTVEACYSETEGMDREDAYSEAQGATLTYLGETRNQWNNDGCGSYTDVSAGDVYFNDFHLSFSYNSLVLKRCDNPENYNVGLFIEKIGDIENDEDGSQITDIKHYENKYESKSSAEELKSALENSTSFNSANGYTQVTNQKIDVKALDNKNQIEYYYYMHASATQSGTGKKANLDNLNHVYRAYSYIGVRGEGGSFTYEISDPVYFLMHD